MFTFFQRIRQSWTASNQTLAETKRWSQRLILLLAIVLVPGFGIVYQWTDPTVVDPLWIRGLITLGLLTAWAASYSSAWVRQHLNAVMQVIIYMIMLWFVALAFVNQFAPTYAIGLLFTIVITTAAFTIHLPHIRSLVYYLTFVTVTSCLSAFGSTAPQSIVFISVSCTIGTTVSFFLLAYIRARVQQRSLQSEQRFRAAIEGSLDAFFLFQKKRRENDEAVAFELIDVNQRAGAFTDRSRFDMLGQSLRDLLPFYRTANRFEQILRAAKTGKPLEAEFEARHDSEKIWIRHQIVQVDENIAISLRDITTQKENELKTVRLKDFYEQIMDNMPAEVVVFNRDGEYMYANSQAISDPDRREALMGLTNEEYCEWRGKDSALGRRRSKRIERVFKTGETIRFEETMTDAEGEDTYYWRVLTPIWDLNERVIQVLGYGIDVTERKKAEEALKASEQRYRLLMDAANDAIFVSDPDEGGIVEANRKAQELTGRSVDELRRMSHVDLHPQENFEAQRQAFWQHILEGSDPPGDLSIVHRDGHEIPVEVSANMIEVGDQRLVLSIFRDVTARKQHEEQLIEAREHAEEMLQLKSNLLNNVSHEIRTPLTGILGFADVLTENTSGEDQEFAEIIAQNAYRLQQTLNSMLDMTRLEHGKIELETEEVDVLEEVKTTVAVLRSKAEEKNLTLSVRGTPTHAHLDVSCLHRIVNNLAGNALKFTDEGAVTLTVKDNEETVYVQVTDTGIGIAESFLPHLFEEFRQQSVGLDRDHQGSGLGLAITQKLVESMQGTISVESEEGVGTTFTVALPHNPNAVASLPADQQHSSAAASS